MELDTDWQRFSIFQTGYTKSFIIFLMASPLIDTKTKLIMHCKDILKQEGVIPQS